MRKNRWHKNPVVALTLLITAALVFAVVPMMPAKVAAAGMPSKLAFTTVAQTIVAGGASKAITVQVQDATGNPINVSGNTTISLASTSGNGKFATRNSGPFSIRSVTVTRGNSSASFYYEDTTAGTPTITASCTSPRLTSATQQETVTASVTASKLAFTTAAQTITAGVASQVMTVQVEDTNGNPVNVTIAATIDLASTSGNGKFATSGSGTFNITSVTITSGNNSASFYYEDTTAGTPTITASCSGPNLTSATQQETETISATPALSISISVPGALLFGQFKAGQNLTNWTNGQVIVASAGTAWTVSAVGSEYMSSGGKNLTEPLLISHDGSTWSCADGSTAGTVPTSPATTYSGKYIVKGRGSSSGSFNFYVDQFIKATDNSLGTYTDIITFTAATAP